MKRLLALAVATVMTVVVHAEPPTSLFDPPVRLMTGSVPINQKEKLLYPSPVLIDLDGDKQPELVLGDLWGKLRVYPAIGKRGELTWGQGKNLQVNGKDLEVPNW
jgi:hypothetical protein